MTQTTENKYKKTVYACFLGYGIQAVVNNFVPLLLLTFQEELGLPFSELTVLITANFLFQLLTDLISPAFIDRIGYRASMLIAHACCALGLFMLTCMPQFFPDPFYGLLMAVLFYAIGGGLLEVLVSPVVEACPTDNKETAMSMLHSFYCWGFAAVVLGSTLFFYLFGTARWRVLCLLWALAPVINFIAFTRVPIAPLIKEGEHGLRAKALLKSPLFWVLTVMMLCAGASEQAVAQWASAFAESALLVDKTTGDLCGPLFFTLMMGLSRFVYGKKGSSLPLFTCMGLCALLCVLSYQLIAMSQSSSVGLLGCGLAGLAVGIFWPGTFSLGAAGLKNGGTLMFALFALAGDMGCAAGPALTGFMTSLNGGNLKAGIGFAVIFPVLMLISLMTLALLNHRHHRGRAA